MTGNLRDTQFGPQQYTNESISNQRSLGRDAEVGVSAVSDHSSEQADPLSRVEALKGAFWSWTDKFAVSHSGDQIWFITNLEGEILSGRLFGQGLLTEQLNPLIAQGFSWSTLGRSAVTDCLKTYRTASLNPNEHSSDLLKECDSLAVPIFNEDGTPDILLGWVGFTTDQSGRLKELTQAAAGISITADLQTELARNRILLRDKERLEREAGLQGRLLQISRKMHTKIDVDAVLSELILTIEKVYNAYIDIFLSQDNESHNSRVKPLVFNTEMDICTRAFMEGQLIHEAGIDNPSQEIVAAPLIGKQGIYGVLQLQASPVRFERSDLEFISSLATTAGNAFENARLYEQSNLLISELRLINEITKRLNQSLKLNDIFDFATKELIEIFAAEYCCILQLDKESDQLIVQASNLPSITNTFFSRDYGYSGAIFATQEPVIVSDYYNLPEQITSHLMKSTSSRSLIGSPIIVNSEVIGTILVTHRLPNFFSYENYKLLQVLSGHIGLAMTNASLHAEVRRRVITDSLTGLYVRHYLDEQVNLQQKQDFCGSLILVDIDFFKRVNDTFGHQVGDEILIQVSSIIKSSIRESDIAARWGGEELAVYLPQVNIEQTIRIAERIRSRVAKETNPRVTVSCGISEWSWEDEKISVETLFYKADMALYEAKHHGKNQLRIRK
ncbi:sensor domain-containing diguanylate cyclase [Paenibacillus swuensis]|uniref:sensor domain-containing diguanylate cyclase n=1 Tax=Paenibacillus swuensis TaxID=1178515 RepID=UPI0008393740|nr:diguanylate cyclase [Paenibacillus swuensis]